MLVIEDIAPSKNC